MPAPHRTAETASAATTDIAAVLILRQLEQARSAQGHVDVRSRRGSWWRSWSWIGLTLLALSAYGLAIGYGPRSHFHNALDGLRMFPSGFPAYESGVRWEYMLAKYLAALVSLFVTFKVVVALFADRFAELRARFRSGHAVVCGLGDTGLRSARALRAAGQRVTCLDTATEGETAHDARDAGALVLGRDATHVSALRSARVDKAAYIVCSCPEDATNARIAALVVGLVHARARQDAPSIHVRINDPELAQLLRGPLASVGPARLHFFNAAAVRARAMLDDPTGPFARLQPAPPRVTVLGGTTLATSVLVGAARRWHRFARTTGSVERLSVTLVAPNATELCTAATERHPAISRVCDLVPILRIVSVDGGALSGSGLAPDAVYACVDDQSSNLALALEADHRLGNETAVFLPADAAAAALGPLLLGVGRIRPVVLPEDAGSIDLLHDDMREELAREAHETYLASRRREGDFGRKPADLPWEQLDEDSRQSNRAHVDGMIEQLRAVWYEIEPLDDWDEEPVELSADVVEAMAELEHARWCRDRLASGWRYGEPRDDRRKVHDCLVPWSALGKVARDTDRDMVRDRPRVLVRAGFKLTRDPAREQLARHLHESYVADCQARGERGPHVMPWNELSEKAREYNRTSVDHIAVKLARVGRRAVPAIVAPVGEMHFSDEEIEAMARLEHERWMQERFSADWRVGPRDEDARTHPSLVPWEDLSPTDPSADPEAERDKDRNVVREIPNLLRSIGYTVTPSTSP